MAGSPKSAARAPGDGISARLASLTPSATLAIDARAKAMRAKGVDVVGFGAGEPDFATPSAIVDAAVAACSDPVNHHYTPSAGLPELRAAIAAKTARDSGWGVEPTQVVVTNGGKHAVYSTFACLLDPGDEVLLPTPYWTTYPEAIALAGGVPKLVRTDESGGFLLGSEELEAARTERTKAVLVCSPCNPSGAVYPRQALADIGRWAAEAGIWVVTDEIYEHLVYGGAEQHSLPVVAPEITERCVVLNGLAKTYAMTGWRVGWLIGPADLAEAAINLQSHMTSNVANVSQRAALAAVSGDLSAVAGMRKAFDRRRRLMLEMLGAIPGVTCHEPLGAFYCFPNLAGLLGRSYEDRRPASTVELAEVALELARVAIVPGEAFGAPGYARLSYALADDDLVEGISRLAKLVAQSGD